MVTIDKTIVERTIENNGILSDSDEITTHIVEYHEIFNRFPTWKLCKSEKNLTDQSFDIEHRDTFVRR